LATVVPSEPRSLAAPQAVADRRELLDLPHIAPLRRYVETLRAQDRGTVPEFAELHRLIALLPRLSAIMLVGRKAGRARSLLGSTRIPLFASAHPSPIVRASRPDLWHGIPGSWAQLVPIVRPDRRGAGST
jgi:hypothetical protein